MLGRDAQCWILAYMQIFLYYTSPDVFWLLMMGSLLVNLKYVDWTGSGSWRHFSSSEGFFSFKT